ncbi:hypothetical protein M426DRAFT_200736 [Hypoxylon sp. CI-4A]|nr:hypothetical protein M426DRAFT_200736 [Hypoxylon sp. CI-4A]
MPKWDKTRNYYADLDLPANASTDEIKKQFKKLALKYHPDRNPGREAEVNPKFQTIQSAHEILSDENLKRQYDDARKGSRYPKSSGVRGNPWQSYGSEFQPPPKRNPQTTPNRPHSGAQRYSTFTTNMPRTTRSSAKEDPKANAYAWEHMRSGSTRRPPPTPGRAPTSAARDTKASESGPVPPVPPRTAYQQQKAQAAFGTSAKRPGFTPHSPGFADEPPVTNKNYFTTRTHSHIFQEVPPGARPTTPTAPRDPSAPFVPDPLAKFREKVWDERQSAPYHSPGGEKTSLFDDVPGLGRTTSTRAPRRSEMPGAFPQTRPRSSSTPKSSANDEGPEDSVKFGKSAQSSRYQRVPYDETSPLQSRRYQFKSTQNGNNPQAQPSTANPQTAFTDGTKAGGNSAQANNGPSLYATPFTNSPNITSSQSPHAIGETSNPAPKKTTYRSSDRVYRLSTPGSRNPSSGGVESDHTGLLPMELMQKNSIDRLINNRSILTRSSSGNNFQDKAGPQSNTYSSATKNDKIRTNKTSSSSFKFGTGGVPPSRSTGTGTGTEGLARHSADSINTRFVDDELPGNWQFSAGSASADEPQTPTKGRPQSRSRNRRPIPRAKVAEPDPMPSTQGNTGNASGTAFFAGEWSDKIGSQHFEPQPSRSTSNSPTRRTNTKKAKPVKMTAGTAGLVDEEESEGWQEFPPKPPMFTEANMDSTTAMDIDSPPPEKTDDTPKASQTNGARKIPVEPHREEWRAGDVNGARAKSTSPPIPEGNATTKEPFTQTAAPKAAPMPTQNPFAANHAGSEDTDEFRTTFTDFAKVEPFVDPAPTGLEAFGDLKSTLPFTSGPSEQIPIEKESQPPKLPTLEFPPPPVAPRLPPGVGVAGARPNQVQFRKYALDFYQYMDKWDNFNARIMAHFSTRQDHFHRRRQQKGAAWLDVNPGGVDYLVELEQDQIVRQQWTQAFADHQAKVREFMKFREQVK